MFRQYPAFLAQHDGRRSLAQCASAARKRGVFVHLDCVDIHGVSDEFRELIEAQRERFV